MSWQTNPACIVLRTLFRRLGLKRILYKLQRLKGTALEYERSFEERLMGAIRPGDCVWDVGANVGYYSLKFNIAANSGGKVVAFEPSPLNRHRLEEALAGCRSVDIRPEALGSASDWANFAQGTDDLGATSRVVPKNSGEEKITVQVERGDALIKSGIVPTPNVIKIDTEGFELEVLLGLENTLMNPALHTVAIEVHFQLLAESGQPGAPAEIEKRLRLAGFTINWTDASHIVARRLDPASQIGDGT